MSEVVTTAETVGVVRMVFAALCYLGAGFEPAHIPIDVQTRRGRVRGEWVGGAPTTPRPIVYYIHGSGFVGCSASTHRGLVKELSQRLDRPAFSLDYRLAPEHTFPAAHDDALNGYLWLLEQGYQSADIVVMGDSAGGHMALSLIGQLRELGSRPTCGNRAASRPSSTRPGKLPPFATKSSTTLS